MTIDPTLLALLVAALSALLAFNLFLSLRLIRIVNMLARARLPDTVPIGDLLPGFHARALADADGRRIRSDALLGDEAAVLVFLSPGCKACLARQPELDRMRPLMDAAGVALWVIAQGRPRRLREYFASTQLLPRVLRISDRDLRVLNPKHSAPFYIFVGADGIVQASDLVGDENWMSFREQVGDLDRPAG
jgi:hypothetical protein